MSFSPFANPESKCSEVSVRAKAFPWRERIRTLDAVLSLTLLGVGKFTVISGVPNACVFNTGRKNH